MPHHSAYDRFPEPSYVNDADDTASNFTRLADARKAFTEYAPGMDWWGCYTVEGETLMDGFSSEDRAADWLEQYADDLEAEATAQTWRAA